MDDDEFRRIVVAALQSGEHRDPYDSLETMGLSERQVIAIVDSVYATYTEVLKSPPLIPDITEEEHQKLSFQGATMTAFWAGFVWAKAQEESDE